MPGLSIRLLGAPQIERDGRPVEVDTRKAIALLAVLAVTARPHARDSLAFLLWPGQDRVHARGALRRTLSTLRRAVGDEALEVSRERIALRRTTALDIDVERFRSRLSAGDDAGPQALAEAIAAYRGDFLDGFSLRDSPAFDDWQGLEADLLRRELAGALDRLGTALAAREDWPAAIAAARRRLALDPLQETAHRRLMGLLAWSGDRLGATTQYRECVRILGRELGVPPLAETSALYRAIADGDALPAPPPPAARAAPRAAPAGRLPLVGREAERAALLSAYREVGEDGRLVVLEGEAGIGKTRLAEEVAAELRAAGAPVLATRCFEDESSLPYAPIAGALRALVHDEAAAERLAALPDGPLAECARLVPELATGRTAPAPPMDSPGSRARMLEGIATTLLAPGAGPASVILVDDLHNADDASLEAVGFLVRRLRGRPALVIGTWRGEEVPAVHPLRRLLADATRAGSATLVPLRRLSEAEVIELVHAADPGGDEERGRRLHRRTEGLPFFVAEWLAAGIDGDLPPSGARDLVRGRLAPVGETARQLLTTAAVIGRSFALDTVRSASGRSPEEAVAGLEELAARGLVVELADAGDAALTFDFGHDIVRSVVYDDAGPARRRLLHGRVADALRAPGGRETRDRVAATAAHHLRLAGRDAEAADELARAGEHAAGLHAATEGLEHFRAALELGHSQPGRLRERCGDLETLLGRYEAAIADYDAAAAGASGAALARIGHKLGALHHRRGDWAVAEERFAAALAALGPAEPAGRARVLADAALTSHLSGDDPGAAARAQEALGLAEASGDAAALAGAHNILGVLASDDGRLSEAREHLERGREAAEGLPDVTAHVAALNNLALLDEAEGRREEALALAEEALALCVRQGDVHREAAIRNNLADLLHRAGRSEDAMRQLKRAVAMFAEVGAAEPERAEIWKLARW